MAFWITLAAVVMVVAAFALGVVAVVLHYRGRHLPRSAVRLCAGLFGAGNGIFLIDFVRVPLALVALAIVAALFAVDLSRRGQRIAAGIMLLTLGLPSGLWWGQFVIADLRDPLDLYSSSWYPLAPRQSSAGLRGIPRRQRIVGPYRSCW
jgi:hypothetical protein